MTERSKIIEQCAVKCEELGDAEFARLAKKADRIGKLALRHYMACAAGIRQLTADEEAKSK